MEEQWAKLSCRRHIVARQGWVPRPARTVREAQGLLEKISQLHFALHQAQSGFWVLSQVGYAYVIDGQDISISIPRYQSQTGARKSGWNPPAVNCSSSLAKV